MSFIQKIKKASESYIVGVDFAALLTTGETIDLPASSLLAIRDGADATLEIVEAGSLLVVDGTKITCRVFDGVGVYVLYFEAHTTDSNIYTEEVTIRVSDDSATPPVIEPPTDGAAIKVLYEAEPDTNAFSTAEQAKLASMAANASDDQTGAEIKLAYEAELDTNAFNDAAVAKLAGIEASATQDQTGAEIKLAYEAELNTNAFTDAIKANVTLNDTHRGSTTGNPHAVTLEEARASANSLSGPVDLNNNDIINAKEVSFSSGQSIAWNTADSTIDVATGFGPVLQVGQETLIKVYNNSGETITKGSAVHPIGALEAYPLIGKSISNSHVTIDRDYGITTMDIPHNSYGFVCRYGKVRNIDTSAFAVNDRVWVSATIAGGVTNVRPSFPNYAAQLGIVFNSDIATGQIFVTGTDPTSNTLQNFWNGVFRESFKFLVASDGINVVGALSPGNGHPNLTMMFSDGLTTLAATPAVQVALTPGSDTIPQTNYVYIPKTTKVLTVSTSSWPSSIEHIRVAQVYLQSAATTLTLGALRNHNWNDHIQNTTTNQGHLSNISARIRREPAKWDTGVEASINIVDGSPDSLYVATTAGKVSQMHLQDFIATDSQTGDPIHIANDSVTPYKAVGDLGLETTDALGNSMSNTCFSLVFWGVANQSESVGHIMMNLPTATYGFTVPATAVSDPSNYAVYAIPKEFEGVGFLIARATFSYKTGNWTLIDVEDLRGRIPNSTAGGGGGGTGVTTFPGLTDTPSAYTGYEGRAPVVNAAETALEFGLTPLMLPELTTTERDAYAIPKNGMMIFNSTTGVFNVYRSGAWVTTLA